MGVDIVGDGDQIRKLGVLFQDSALAAQLVAAQAVVMAHKLHIDQLSAVVQCQPIDGKGHGPVATGHVVHRVFGRPVQLAQLLFHLLRDPWHVIGVTDFCQVDVALFSGECLQVLAHIVPLACAHKEHRIRIQIADR